MEQASELLPTQGLYYIFHYLKISTDMDEKEISLKNNRYILSRAFTTRSIFTFGNSRNILNDAYYKISLLQKKNKLIKLHSSYACPEGLLHPFVRMQPTSLAASSLISAAITPIGASFILT